MVSDPPNHIFLDVKLCLVVYLPPEIVSRLLFQLRVVDYPTPLPPEIVSLTQDQAFLISHSRLLPNCITSKKM